MPQKVIIDTKSLVNREILKLIYLFIYMLEDHQTGSIVKTFVFQKE